MSDPRDPDAAYIPADDVILRGYCGPCEIQIRMDDEGPPDWMIAACVGGGVERAFWADQTVLVADRFYVRLYQLSVVRLDPALAPVRDHIARVMAEGVRCPRCHGDGTIPDPMQIHPPMCQDCSGFGYLPPPSPIEHLLDRPGSRLTADESAACVAWSYRSWRVGGPVLRGVIAPYYDAIDNGWGRVDCVGAGVSVGVYPRARENGQGWRVIFHGTDDTPDIEVSGPETGPDGRACADRAALAHNFALLNDDGSVTTPDLPTDRSPK